MVIILRRFCSVDMFLNEFCCFMYFKDLLLGVWYLFFFESGVRVDILD